ncbi:MAG: 4-(cytidine 5'-diphospho)-2-C-methyl-D-erythritol kinase [Candidatus Eisenbacteria bacterium]|nr:4-(cytidine 5'-diphospho)-2-C-methyl-D-erythritol kinase [Candidatus Eisenbacteria bacterium]
MKWLEIEAYAKVNLGLAVLSRRSDGYHEIDTVLHTISLSDRIRLEGPMRSWSLETTGLEVPSDEGNLALRAGRKLEELEGCPPFRIRLEKRIPVAAGLGGGSSDAAAVLRGAEELFGLEVGRRRLEEIALGLGSDVPFLVRGGAARGRGRGERLSDLPVLEGAWLVLATPRTAVSSAKGYEHARIGLTRSERLIRLSCSAIREGRAGELPPLLHNDLEAGVVSFCPDVAAARAALSEAGARGVVMSGSGPTVLGLARGEEEARGIVSRLKGRDFEINVARPTRGGSRITGRSGA